MNRRSDVCVLRSKKTWPQSLIGWGSFAARFNAAGENSAGDTVVPTNGACSAIVRPAAGGDEAGLFSAELFAMYQKYAAAQGWRFEVLAMEARRVDRVRASREPLAEA